MCPLGNFKAVFLKVFRNKIHFFMNKIRMYDIWVKFCLYSNLFEGK